MRLKVTPSLHETSVADMVRAISKKAVLIKQAYLHTQGYECHIFSLISKQLHRANQTTSSGQTLISVRTLLFPINFRMDGKLIT